MPRTNPFRPLLREVQILYYRWARKDLRFQPTHPDLPLVIMHLNDLLAERPRPALRNRCAGAPGMCMADAACADYDCQNHPWQMHFGNGGHQVAGEISVRMHARPTLDELQPVDRALLGIAGATAVAVGCAIAVALGCPICLPF